MNPRANGEGNEAIEGRVDIQEFVYNQVAHLTHTSKEPYTATELFEQNKFELTAAEHQRIFEIYAFDETGPEKRLGALADTPEGHAQILTALREEKDTQERLYNTTVETKETWPLYSYPDLLTDANRYKQPRIKQRIFQELMAADEAQEVLDYLTAEAEVYAEMTEQPINADLITSILDGEYGVMLDSELVPEDLRKRIMGYLDSQETVE